MRRGFPLTLIRTAPASGETQERRTMKRYLTLFAKMMALFAFASSPCKADGVFTVTQYNLNTRPNSIDVAENVLKTPSIWVGSPVTKTYSTISFADNPGVNPPFSMVSFPGNGAGKHECFVVEAAGFIKLDAGSWTFACGGDDGYSVSISGHGFSSSFVSAMPLGYDVTTKTMDIPSSGIYHVRILYFEYGACAVLHFSSANGPYSSFNSSMFHLVKAVEVFTVSFNANGGSGKMETEEAVSGEVITLPDNAFFLNGYVFQGWATSPDGPVVYSDGAEITVDSDKTLYAVWKAEGGMIQLSVARADPAAGSLTLAWEEEKPIEGVTYSVWRGRTGDERSAAVCVAPNVTGNTWTDEEYWKAEPVLEPLRYWVVADAGGKNERESNCVETRHRYGVFVGVGEYEESWFKQLTGRDWLEWNADRPAMVHAELFGRLVREKGGFPADAVSVLTGSHATKSAFHNALQDLAKKVQTGDYVAIFCSTHGHLQFWYKYYNGIVMHDTLYSKKELASDLEALATDKNGLNVVVILSSCYSGAAYSASPAGQDFAWILSSRGSEETTTFSDAMGVPLSHYLLEYGWNRGRAGQGPGTMATFADLWDYAKLSMSEFRRMGLLDETQQYAQRAVLEHFIAGRLGSAQYENVPGTPTVTVAATNEGLPIISWKADSQAEYFAWIRENENNGKQLVGMATGDMHTWHDEGQKLGISYLPVQSCLYRIAAINEHGISAWSEPARGTFPSKFWNWLVDKYVGSVIDESTSEEIVATVAASASPNGASYEACYVADIDPNDPDVAFKAKLVCDDGKWRVCPMDGEKEGRVYRVEGKKEMSDENWTDVTDVEDQEVEGWHFFRVGVELAE